MVTTYVSLSEIACYFVSMMIFICFVRNVLCTLYYFVRNVNTHLCSNCSHCQYFFFLLKTGHQVVCQNVEQYFFSFFFMFY